MYQRNSCATLVERGLSFDRDPDKSTAIEILKRVSARAKLCLSAGVACYAPR